MSSPSAAAVPAALWRWLTALAEAVPARSALTFLELRVGAMISGRGFVTEAILAIAARRGWQAYYWWLEKGRWSWVAVARRLCSLLATDFPSGPWHLVIDDTLVPRASKKAPAAGTHFDHSRKPNRPTYIWGQGWVTLAAIVRGRSVASSWAVPLLSRLVRKGGKSLNPAPVYPIKQGRQLGGGQRHGAVGYRRPNESPSLQSLLVQHQAGAVPHQNPHSVGPARAASPGVV